MYVVDPNLCPQNHKCPLINLCPVEAITQDGFGVPKMDHDLCIRCGKCEATCFMKAVKEVDEQ